VSGTRLGEDIEALHQMRVATRRMRAALDMYADVLPVRAARLHDELGWLAAVLGDVRDLDIQIGRFDDWTEEMSGELREALDELADLLVAERVRARTALLEALDSKRYERLVSGLTAMLVQGPSSRSMAGRASAVSAMPALIGERHRAAGKAARRATRTAVAGDYHRLRIRCKRLRYALEFASGLYDGELKGFVRQMARLQDTLGSMQDAQVASSRLQAIALTEEGASLSRATIFAMGGVAGRYHSEAEHLLTELPALVDLLKGKEWNRAKSLMELRQQEAAALAHLPVNDQAREGPLGRARPALATLSPALATLSPAPVGTSRRRAASRPGPETARPVSESARSLPGPVSAPATESEPVTHEETAPAGDPGAEGGSTTITPIRRQVAPS
jgi:CHAD domain-containing protein